MMASRAEAIRFLYEAREALFRLGDKHCANDVWEVQVRLETSAHLTGADLHALADFWLPSGRHGRAVLVLRAPVEARTRVLIATVLRRTEPW